MASPKAKSLSCQFLFILLNIFFILSFPPETYRFSFGLLRGISANCQRSSDFLNLDRRSLIYQFYFRSVLAFLFYHSHENGNPFLFYILLFLFSFKNTM
jgi:hypothetical protein